jgi:hypothetical protein
MSTAIIEDDDDNSSTSPSASDPDDAEEDGGSTLGSTHGSTQGSRNSLDDDDDDSRNSLDDDDDDDDDSQRSSLDGISLTLRRLEDNDPNLVELDVHAATTDPDEARCISVVLPENTRLQRLLIDCGNDKSRCDVVRKVVSGLRGNASIRRVEIRDLTMDRDTSWWMAQSLGHSKSVDHVCMTGCRFVGSGVGTLLVTMQHMKQLRHLSFRHCEWDDHNAEIVATSLPYLKLLSLSLVGINVAVDSWPFLFNSIKRSRELIFLDMSHNIMDDAVVGSLARVIAKQNSISTLVLSSCGIDDDCAKELARGLRGYSTLTSLDISKNGTIARKGGGTVRLTRKGVVHLRELLKVNTSITELKVHGCGLDKKSLIIIEGCLRYNNSILKSFLSENASQRIFDVVDRIEKFDIGEGARNIVEAVSFGPVKFDIGEGARNIVQAVSFGGSTCASEQHRGGGGSGGNSATPKSPPRGEDTTPRRATARRVTPRAAKQAVRYTMKESCTPTRGQRDVFL